MAWITKSGQTSDRELEAATRRGTEPRTGIRDKSVERAKTQEAMDRISRHADMARRGDYSFFWEE